MSRHRNVRAINYDEECEGYDDVYGHSVEDDFLNSCVSPGTAAQFTFNRNDTHSLSSYVAPSIKEEDAEEDEEVDADDEPGSSPHDMACALRQRLNAQENARLNGCLETMAGILGESTSEAAMIDAVLAASYDTDSAINILLNQQDAPKQQRSKIRPSTTKGPDTMRAQGSKLHYLPAATSSSTFASSENFSVPRTSSVPVISANMNRGMSKLAATDSNRTGAVLATKRSTDNASVSDASNKLLSFSIGPCLTEADAPTITGNKKPGKVNGEMCAEVTGVASLKKNNELIHKSASSGELLQSTEQWNEYMDIGGDGSRAASIEPPGTPRREIGAGLAITPSLQKSASKAKIDRLDVQKEYERRKVDGGKEFINLIVIGHVDAGKSTLMGHLLYQLGFVNKRTMHKYEQDSRKIGKGSFAYAWVLDETEEERSRGVTMDIAQTRFETKTKVVTLLDAPGHKDFIPNMITGAARADVAVLVINATNGEFETGFDAGGQTREHAMLVRSLGVSQLLIAINKMDTVDWSQARYDDIVRKLGQFLKQAGFRETDISYVPCSGLSGDNLTSSLPSALSAWYTGPTLVDQIDMFKPPERPIMDKPLRMCVSDVFKGTGAGLSVAGTVQTGSVQAGDKVLSIPAAEMALVKAVMVDDSPVSVGFAGDNVVVTLTGIDATNVSIGSILCDPLSPVETTSRFRARIIVFNIDIPITKGFPVVLHYQSLSEQAYIRRLVSQLNRNTGDVIKKSPRCLVKNTSAIVDIEVDRPISVELYRNYRDLGRFMLRSAGATIAAGMVIEILSSKPTTAQDTMAV